MNLLQTINDKANLTSIVKPGPDFSEGRECDSGPLRGCRLPQINCHYPERSISKIFA